MIQFDCSLFSYTRIISFFVFFRFVEQGSQEEGDLGHHCRDHSDHPHHHHCDPIQLMDDDHREEERR